MSNFNRGQLCRIKGMPKTWAVLREKAADAEVWYAWPVVAADAEKAGYWDLLVDVTGTECAKDLADNRVLSQSWNGILVLEAMLEPSDDCVTEDTLQAMEAASEDWLFGPATNPRLANPGTWIERKFGDFLVVTGTPFGEDGTDQPRLKYQSHWNSMFLGAREDAYQALGVTWD
jgi:hypothetical protein